MTGMSMYQDMKSNPASAAAPPIAAPPKSIVYYVGVYLRNMFLSVLGDVIIETRGRRTLDSESGKRDEQNRSRSMM